MKTIMTVLLLMPLLIGNARPAKKTPPALTVKRDGMSRITVLNYTGLMTVHADIKISKGPGAPPDYQYSANVMPPAVTFPYFPSTCNDQGSTSTYAYITITWTGTGRHSWKFVFADGTTYGCKPAYTATSVTVGYYLYNGCGDHYFYLYNGDVCAS